MEHSTATFSRWNLPCFSVCFSDLFVCSFVCLCKFVRSVYLFILFYFIFFFYPAVISFMLLNALPKNGDGLPVYIMSHVIQSIHLWHFRLFLESCGFPGILIRCKSKIFLKGIGSTDQTINTILFQHQSSAQIHGISSWSETVFPKELIISTDQTIYTKRTLNTWVQNGEYKLQHQPSAQKQQLVSHIWLIRETVSVNCIIVNAEWNFQRRLYSIWSHQCYS